MTYRYSSIAIMMLLVSASSFAASAVLPPLPGQQPPPVVQDSAKSPPPLTEPTPPAPLTAPPTAEKQNPVESLPSPTQVSPQVPTPPVDQAGVINPPAPAQAVVPPAMAPASAAPVTAPTLAPTQAPTPGEKKISASPQDAQEESESFIDTGQKQLPRIQQGDKSADSGSYNPSDLRIPVIESAEKDAAKNDAAKNNAQSNPQVAEHAAAPAPDSVQAVPAAHVGPNVSLPEALHPAQAADSAAVVPSVAAQTPPQAPATATKAVATAPVVSAPPPSTPAPVMAQTPPQVPSQVPPKASAPAVADAAPVLVPAPAPPLAPVPVPPPPPAPAVGAQHPQAATIPAAVTTAPPASTQPSPRPVVAASSPVMQLTADQIKFIDDEAIVFTLADDDVELGELTEEAEISQMPAYNYIKLFWKNYQTPLDKMQERDVDLFLAMLETYPSAAYAGAMNGDEASNQAFDAASEGKLSDLRAIISYYAVLQMRDARGNNMLGTAIESDRLEVARFLLIRGIDLYATNYEGYDAFAIAGDENNDEATDLLNRARFLGRR